jgi:sulfite exporter TauE/SafE
MCGGIVAACTSSRRAPGAPVRWRFAFAYNAGRMASYTFAGVLAGAAGQTTLLLNRGPAMERVLLVAAGCAMVLLALYMAGVTRAARRFEAAGAVLWRALQPYSRHVLPADTPLKALGLGALWGWLPCGMVYSVLLTAVASGGAVEGGLVMAAFGAGTLPNLLAITAVAGRLRHLSRSRRLRGAVAAAVAGVGVLAVLIAVDPHAFTEQGVLCRYVPQLAGLQR